MAPPDLVMSGNICNCQNWGMGAGHGWCTPVIPRLGKLRQKDYCEVKASLGYRQHKTLRLDRYATSIQQTETQNHNRQCQDTPRAESSNPGVSRPACQTRAAWSLWGKVCETRDPPRPPGEGERMSLCRRLRTGQLWKSPFPGPRFNHL